jgi:hypothetical protein
MKNTSIAIAILVSVLTTSLMAQTKRTSASAGRIEYIEVQKKCKTPRH